MYNYLHRFYLSRLQIEKIKTVFYISILFHYFWGDNVTGVKVSLIH